jgi:hypothetical protein
LFIAVIVLWPLIHASGEKSKRLCDPRAKLVVAFLASCAGCFLLLPQQLPGQNLIYQRFSVLVLIGLILLASILFSRRFSGLVASAVTVVALAMTALWLEYYHDFNQQNTSFTPAVFPEPSPDRLMGGIIYDYAYRGQPVYLHFPSYYIVWRQGIASSTMFDYRFGTVRRQVGLQVLPVYIDWVAKLGEVRPEWYAGFDYLLVRGTIPDRVGNPLRDFKLAKDSGPWSLYERR